MQAFSAEVQRTIDISLVGLTKSDLLALVAMTDMADDGAVSAVAEGMKVVNWDASLVDLVRGVAKRALKKLQDDENMPQAA